MWLDEIEEMVVVFQLRHANKEDIKRMARVLREQSVYIKLLDKKYIAALGLHFIHGMNTVDAELKEAHDNLSDDAKELLKSVSEVK